MRSGRFFRRAFLGMALAAALMGAAAVPGAADSGTAVKAAALEADAAAGKGGISEKLAAGRPATAVKMPTKRTITAGLKAKIQVKAVNAGESLTGLKWKSSKPSVATVSCTGILLGYREGTTTVTCTLKNGKVYRCVVTVRPNVFTEAPFQKIKFKRDGSIELAPVKYYYSGNTLKAVFGIYNGKSGETIDYFSEVTFKITGLKKQVLFSGKIKNVNINLKPGAKKQVTFNLPVKNGTRYDLGKIGGIGYSCSYYYYVK